MEVSGVLSRTPTFSSLTKPRRLPTPTISHTNLVPTRFHYPNPIFSSTSLLMDFNTTFTTKPLATPLQANGSSLTTSSPIESGSTRIGEVKRVTKETNVSVKINLDGTGIADSTTCIPFLDHMLDQLSSHGLFDLHVRATGDIHIDDHHTNEDVALAVGTEVICENLPLQALLQALGDRKGINRFGDFSAPLDEALIHVSLDLSGRPYLGYDLQIPTQRVGKYDTQVLHFTFFASLCNNDFILFCLLSTLGYWSKSQDDNLMWV
ncbi:hypothetical protein DKX38_015363 [Salix brachista]|uniref:imidazoleglycerol-phosphate dehydratase n=1 Tax=Salix brachista TaxID=2182728 RepID=A0A5N5L5D1_9ROSI|nr:hypothetical protein DKX38_015363 [Salix brachista]